jgi:hypothetical protein
MFFKNILMVNLHNNLFNIANNLDKFGYSQEADCVTKVMLKFSNEFDSLTTQMNPIETIPRMLELDQWHGTALKQMIDNNSAPSFEAVWDDQDALFNINGTDTDAIKKAFGGIIKRLTDIPKNKKCPIGYMRFAEGSNGELQLIDYNYDTSD